MTRKLVFIVFPDFQLLDAAGPIAAFEMANRMISMAYELTLVSQVGGLVRSSSGISLLAMPFSQVSDADTMIAVGGGGGCSQSGG